MNSTTIRAWALFSLASLVMLNISRAALTVDLQATSATGATLTNNKLIQNATVGAVINFNVVALVTGANGDPNDEGLVTLQGGFLTSFGGPILGNVSNALLNSNFDAPASQNGLPNSLDGDVDIDWGGLSNGSVSGWLFARADMAPTPLLGASHLIGTVSLTLTSVTPGNITFNFIKRMSAVAATWQEDGVLLPNQGQSLNYGSGADVVISTVPEPSSLALGGIALVGLAAVSWQRRQLV